MDEYPVKFNTLKSTDRLQNVTPSPLLTKTDGILSTEKGSVEAAIATKDGASTTVALSRPTDRTLRFPTVAERVRFYMSSWYEPPCSEVDLLQVVQHTGSKLNSEMGDTTIVTNGGNPIIEFGGHEKRVYPSFSLQRRMQSTNNSLSVVLRARAMAGGNVIFALDKTSLDVCQFGPQPKKILWQVYCPELRDKLLLPYLAANQTKLAGKAKSGDEKTLILAQVGDALATRVLNDLGEIRHQSPKPSVPHFKKVRSAWEDKDGRESLLNASPVACSTLQSRRTNHQNLEPIIWKMEIDRHYGAVHQITEVDIPWDQKRNVGVFRGATTGNVNQRLPMRERCLENQRCQLVLMYHNSSFVDAKFTNVLKQSKLPTEFDGITMTGSRFQLDELLEFKVLIFLEGNDVSSGLKWGLYSNSVVLINKPSVSSWAMEELLEPWVHYVPLKDDLTDAETQIKWVIEHDREAKEIAIRGQLWIHDLLFDEHSERDNAAINQEIFSRYEAHFRPGIEQENGQPNLEN